MECDIAKRAWYTADALSCTTNFTHKNQTSSELEKVPHVREQSEKVQHHIREQTMKKRSSQLDEVEELLRRKKVYDYQNLWSHCTMDEMKHLFSLLGTEVKNMVEFVRKGIKAETFLKEKAALKSNKSFFWEFLWEKTKEELKHNLENVKIGVDFLHNLFCVNEIDAKHFLIAFSKIIHQTEF